MPRGCRPGEAQRSSPLETASAGCGAGVRVSSVSRHAGWFDELADEVVLRALHQRCHGDREADAERHPETRYYCLAAAAEDVRQRKLQQQPHRPLSARTRAPSTKSGAATDHLLALREATSYLDLGRPLDSERDRVAMRHPSLDHEDAPVLDNPGRHEQVALRHPHDDVHLHRHPDRERRVVGQIETAEVGLADPSRPARTCGS